LVAIEKGGVVNGAVMMDLAPAVIEQAEDARGAESEIEDGCGAFETAPFLADGVENFSRNVKRIIVKLDGDVGWAREKALVNTANLRPATLDAAERVVHGTLVGWGPILAHEDEVAGVKGTIKLSESVTRMGEIAEIFVAGNGVERRGKSG
jgi:hypothetical protein